MFLKSKRKTPAPLIARDFNQLEYFRLLNYGDQANQSANQVESSRINQRIKLT